MTNTCELPLSTEIIDRPKLLSGLNQKVCGRIFRYPFGIR